MARNAVWRGAVWLSLGSFVSKLIGAVYRIFLPRLLGDYGVGLFQMAFPLYAVLLAVSVNGIPTALSKQMAEKLSQGDFEGAEALGSWAQLSLGILGMILSALMEYFAPWLARTVFSEPQAVYAIRALAPALAFVALEAGFRGYFQGYENMGKTAVSQVLEQIARVAAMFPLALWLLPRGIAQAAAGATLGAPVGAFLGMIYLLWGRLRHKGFFFGRRVPVRELRQLFLVALPMSLSGLLFPLMILADSVFVPQRLRLTGMTLRQATAQYGQLSGEAMPLINLSLVVGAALAVSLVPTVARAMVGGKPREAHDKVSIAIHLVWMMGLPMSGGLWALAHPLTRLLYGEPGAAGALQVLAVGSTVLAVQQVLGSSLQSAGHGWIPVKNLLWGTFTKFFLTWWLTPLPNFGIRGAALGTVVASVVTAYLNWRDWTRVAGQSGHPWKSAVWPFTGTIVMIMAIEAWQGFSASITGAWSNLAAIPIGVLVYVIFMTWAGETRVFWRFIRER